MEVKELLKHVGAINKKYEEFAELTGEDYNIFKILKMERKEVRLHAAFLADLLNANGSHGCMDVFARLFIEQQLERQKEYPEFVSRLSCFQTSKSEATAEKHIGYINEERNEGGSIDILLKDQNSNCIVLENKIGAGEQNSRGIRYNARCPSAPIFYLTLSAKPINEANQDTLIEGREYVCISYQNDILLWLEACKEKSVNKPLLRETIIQYIYLIRSLTNQSDNKNMSMEVINEIVHSEESLQSAFNISGTIEQVKNQLFNQLKDYLQKIGTVNKCTVTDANLGMRNSSMRFKLDSHTEMKFFFAFDSLFGGFSVGVNLVDPDAFSVEMNNLISERLSMIFGETLKRTGFAYHHYFTDHWANWTNGNLVWKGIITRETQKQFKVWINRIVFELQAIDSEIHCN